MLAEHFLSSEKKERYDWSEVTSAVPFTVSSDEDGRHGSGGESEEERSFGAALAALSPEKPKSSNPENPGSNATFTPGLE